MPPSPVTFPAGAGMFFCIGAQKAGTTWLYDLLSQSPACHFCRNKELHYFDVIAGQGAQMLKMRRDIAVTMADRIRLATGPVNSHTLRQLRDIADLMTIYTGPAEGPNRHDPYLEYLLQGYAGQPVVCDITPAYAILDRATFADMAEIGQAKFLFILRDPVGRMWSQIRMGVGVRNPQPEDYAKACTDHAQTLIDTGRLPKLGRTNYARTIAELEAVVPADRIKYVFYENLFRQDTVDSICAFLGIAPLAADATRRVNEGQSLPIPPVIGATFRALLSQQYEFAQDRFGDALPAAWSTIWPAKPQNTVLPSLRAGILDTLRSTRTRP